MEIDGRSYFVQRSAFHPYFLGGISLALLQVSGGARYQGKMTDAVHAGGGIKAGLGLAVEIGPSIVLDAGAATHFLWFLYAYGGGKGRDINNLTEGAGGPQLGRPLRTASLVFSVGLGFIL